ncbi:HNH endonuclease [uncultured Alsobacter sp.]|uniref:HNH endonuclease n=1 Tax=uncultured Alsobacter sp. TaxID=1748258 RepID=UPI0025CFEFF5|nr:HNH endonuclease [uncultured Alsobacter sp.]
MSIPHDVLLSRLSYDKETGDFRWLIKPCAQVEIGDVAGTIANTGYRVISLLGRTYLAHRLAWFYVTGEWPKGLIDHKNRTEADNRWDNLRPAGRPENGFNAVVHRDNRSGVKGVWWSQNRWCAGICVRGKRIHLGRFTSIEDAAEAYRMAAEKHHGEFALAGQAVA